MSKEIIDNVQWEMKTVSSLYRQLSYSINMIEDFDPDNEDIEGRRAATAFEKRLRNSIRMAYKDWVAEND